MIDPAIIQLKKYTDMPRLKIALQNILTQAAPDGRVSQFTVSEFMAYLAPRLTTGISSGFVQVEGTELPKPNNRASWSWVGAGTFTMDGATSLTTTSDLNFIYWNGSAWVILQALNLVAPRPVFSNNIADASAGVKVLLTTGPDGKQHLSNILDRYTGETVTATETASGVTVDNIMYFEYSGKKFKRDAIDGINIKWFGVVGDGVANDSVAFQKAANVMGSGRLLITEGMVINLQTATVPLPEGCVLDFRGGIIKNGSITGTNSTITGNVTMTVADLLYFRGTYTRSDKVYNYATVADMKNAVNWPNKVCQTNGFHFENDKGGATYIINLATYFATENTYFNSYWRDTNIAGGAGLYISVMANKLLYAKYISSSSEVNLAVFGVKYDALFLNPTNKKYYSDAAYTIEATDNYNAVNGAIGQLQWWSLKNVPRTLVLSGTLIINTKLTLTHGAYNFKLKGTGYSDDNHISSNLDLDVLIENYYSSGTLPNLTATTYVLEDLAFKGNGRIKNGLIVKNGYEADGLNRLQFHDFVNAGLTFYGISSTFKCDTISCFRNKYGVLITSTHPFNGSTNNMEGLVSLYKVSGDLNTDSLIAIDIDSAGASINIQSLKSERNNLSTIHIIKASPQTYVSVKNAFTNGDSGDFIRIENYAGELPTIEYEGVFHNDTNSSDWDINDLKNAKQIRFTKNPTAAFPHVIYTNNVRTYQNGFMVYRNGDKSNLDTAVNFGTTAQRPLPLNIPYIGFQYLDNTLGKPIWWNGTVWKDATGVTVS